jgi:hypothetical protein
VRLRFRRRLRFRLLQFRLLLRLRRLRLLCRRLLSRRLRFRLLLLFRLQFLPVLLSLLRLPFQHLLTRRLHRLSRPFQRLPPI